MNTLYPLIRKAKFSEVSQRLDEKTANKIALKLENSWSDIQNSYVQAI